MKDNMKKVQVYFTNKFAAHMYSNSDYRVYSSPLYSDMYEVRMLDEVLDKGPASQMERFFYERMMEDLALDAQEAIDEEMDRVGFIDDSDNTERFLDTLAEGLLAEIDEDFDNTDLDWLTYEMKNLMAEKYGKIGECDKAANYSGFFYKSDERFETIEEFLIAFGLVDEPEKYYYFIGHDWTEGKELDEYFIEFENIKNLADSFYDRDVEKALADDEYVFNQEEYDAWIGEVEEKAAKEEAAKRARMLDTMDSFVRNNIQDEEIFQGWLLVVPDDADMDDYRDMGADEQCFIEVCELFISLLVQENAMNIKRSLYCDMLQEFICKVIETGGRI